MMSARYAMALYGLHYSTCREMVEAWKARVERMRRELEQACRVTKPDHDHGCPPPPPARSWSDLGI